MIRILWGDSKSFENKIGWGFIFFEFPQNLVNSNATLIWLTEVIYKYFLAFETAYERWDTLFSKNEKKQLFSSAYKEVLEKNSKFNFKIWDFANCTFSQFCHQEVSLVTSHLKKLIFRIILKRFCLEMFFIYMSNNCCSTSAFKVVFSRFFTFQTYKKSKNKKISENQMLLILIFSNFFVFWLF